MKIAILADPIDNQNAGVHVYTHEMVEAMIRTNPGHEIILIREKSDILLKGAVQIAVWNTRLPVGFASMRLFFIIPFILRRIKADVVIEPARFGPFNLPSATKRITIIHDLTPILFPGLHRWHSQMLQKIFLRRILKKADLIITNSDNTSSDVCVTYPESCKKVRRIYPGKSDIYSNMKKPGVLEKYKIHSPYFLCVGTIEPRKNLNVLLEAFRLFMLNTSQQILLIIAGGKGWKSKPFYKALENHPDRDKIICTGFVDTEDLPTLYSGALALIYPSVYEGFGLPVVEAISCGTPVIAARNSSLLEAGGSSTLYFDAKNPKDLSTHMSDVSKNLELRKIMSSEGIKYSEKFNWNNFALQFWNSIDELKNKIKSS